ENLVSCTYYGVKARLLQARGFEKRRAIGGLETGDLLFEGRADGDDGRVFLVAALFDRDPVLVALEVGERCLVDVGDVAARLSGEELHVAHDRLRVDVVGHGVGARGLGRFEMRRELLADLRSNL